MTEILDNFLDIETEEHPEQVEQLPVSEEESSFEQEGGNDEYDDLPF